MHAFSNLATPPVRIAALILLAALTSTLACASGGCRRDDYRGVACRAAAAREDLTFGLSRDAAIDAIGRTEAEPPWANILGIGPAVISNPFDSETIKSPIGEEYEVVRFYVEATGEPDCPFVQGELKLEPLIFVEDRLVGWRWSYLADVLGKRISTKARRWDFGAFCDRRPPSATDEDPSDSNSIDSFLPKPTSPEANPPEQGSQNPDPPAQD